MRCRYFNILLIICAALVSRGTRPAIAATYPINGFSELQGQVVNDIAEDSLGRIWLATNSGVWIWDGYAFVKIALPFRQKPVRCLLEDHAGLMWIGAYGVLGAFDVYSLSAALPEPFAVGGHVNAILLDLDGSLWAGVGPDRGGLYQITGNRDTGYAAGAIECAQGVKVFSIDYDGKDGLLIGSHRRVYRYASGQLQPLFDDAIEPHLADDLLHDEAPTVVRRTADGTIWIGLRRPGGLFRAVGRDVFRMTPAIGLLDEEVNAITEAPNGDVWISTERGAFLWTGDRFTRVAQQDGLHNDDVHDVFIDRENQVWIGTFGGGAYRLRSPAILNYALADGLDHMIVKDLVVDGDGRILVGTLRGVGVLNQKSRIVEPIQSGVHVRALYADSRGNIWIGARNSVCMLGGEEWSMGRELVSRLFEDRDDNLLIGTNMGLHRLEEDGPEPVDCDPSVLGRLRRVTDCAFSPAGDMFVSTMSGVAAYRDGTWATVHTGTPVASLLPCPNKGMYVGGNRTGLHLLENDTLTQVATGYPALQILNDLAHDGRALWVATSSGLLRLEDGRSFLYGTADGLPSSDVRCLLTDDAGRLFVGTTAGLAQIDSDKLSPCAAGPIVSVGEWSIGQETRRAAATRPQSMENKPAAIFRIHKTGWRSAVGVQYRYWLEGFEDDWSDWTDDSVRRYASLPPGDYRFKAQAINVHGVTSERDAVMAFSVAAPFWRQGWFASLVGFLLIVAVALYVNRRIRLAQFAAERRQRETELAHVSRVSIMGEMAAGIAHELNQPLTAINNYAHGCIRKLDGYNGDAADVAAALQRMTQQAERAGDIIRRVRGFIKKEEFQRAPVDVAELIREAATFLSADAKRLKIHIRLELANELPKMLVDSVQIQQVVVNLMLNAMEAMSDTPARNRELTISTQPIDGEGLCVTISDRGSGIPPEAIERAFDPFYSTKETGMGMGLSISRTIIENHGGRIWAERRGAGGSSIHFTLKIPSEVADGIR